MKEISKAFLAAQAEMSNPKKGTSNSYFKSKYADLNAVREAVIPVLNEHGISVLQPMTTVDGKNYIKTMLLHESGETIESLTEIIYAKTNDAQAQGSGITYARRYGLQSLVCVGADDDDGNAASTPPQQKKIERDGDISVALDEVKRSKTVDELEIVWKNWSCFHGDATFKTAVKDKKAKL
jgi:hypothetical protein